MGTPKGCSGADDYVGQHSQLWPLGPLLERVTPPVGRAQRAIFFHSTPYLYRLLLVRCLEMVFHPPPRGCLN